MFKVNNKDIKTTFTGILISLLLTLNIFLHCSGVSVVDFEQVNAGF